MRKLSLIFFVVMLAACGNNSGNSSNDKKENDTTKGAAAATPADQSMTPEQEKGMNLVAQSDCLTCHQIDAASTGPSYMSVAGKYPDNDAVIDSLSQKIIKGGMGNWGTVPMIAHPSISPEDAKLMVKYVLSLK